MTEGRFIYTIRTLSEDVEVVAYRPFDGAFFCVHRHINNSEEWVITHEATSLKLPREYRTKDEALDLAGKLSKGCPSAAAIKWDGTANDGAGAGLFTGPREALRSEVVAVLEAAA